MAKQNSAHPIMKSHIGQILAASHVAASASRLTTHLGGPGVCACFVPYQVTGSHAGVTLLNDKGSEDLIDRCAHTGSFLQGFHRDITEMDFSTVQWVAFRAGLRELSGKKNIRWFALHFC